MPELVGESSASESFADAWRGNFISVGIRLNRFPFFSTISFRIAAVRNVIADDGV